MSRHMPVSHGIHRLMHWQALVIPLRGEKPSMPFLFMAILTGCLVWITTFPPMTDLPQHAAQVAIFLRLLNGTEPWGEIYRINWLTPYWAGYILTALIALWVPVLIAIKIVIGIAITMTAISAAYLRREVGGSAEWDWLFLPIGFGFAFDWGFLNFIVAIPISLFYMTLCVAYLRGTRNLYIFAVMLASILLFLCHVLIAFFACLLGVILASMTASGIVSAFRRGVPFIVPVPFMLLWGVFILAPEAQAKMPAYWNITSERFSEIIAYAAGQQNELIFLPLAIIAIGAPFLSGARFSADWRWRVPFILFVAWMLLGPDHIFGNGFTYQRFGVFFFPLLVLALRPCKDRSVHYSSRMLMPIVGVALLLPTAYRLYCFENESADFRSVVVKIPAGGRLLAAIVDRHSNATSQSTYLHFGAWYSALGPGTHEFSFSSFVPEIVRFKRGGSSPIVPMGLEWSPINYTPKMLSNFDYLLVRKGGKVADPQSPSLPCLLPVIERSGGWVLYSVKRSVPSSLFSCYFFEKT